jgi:dTDP-4-dehydrorhamnose reductase
MARILILDGDDSFGFRFAKDYGISNEIRLLEPLKGIERFIESITCLPDSFDFIINNFDMPFYYKNTNYMQMNAKIQEMLDEKFHNGKKILLSSQFVYSSSPKPKNENSATVPETEYGKTRLEAEQSIKLNEHFLIIRRGLTYGKCTYNIYTDILAAIRAKMPMKLNNNIRVSPILNSDLALIVNKTMKDLDRDIINAAGEETMTLYEFGNRLYSSIHDDKCPFIKTYGEKPLDYTMDMTRISNLYGLKFTGTEEVNFMNFLK